MSTIKVHYLVKDNLETDERTGHNFRWQVVGETAHVVQHNRKHRIVWTKSYAHVVSLEWTA